MSYNTDLQNNNTSLQEILATIESLPEAGGSSGGAEIETCTITLHNMSSCIPTYEGHTIFTDGEIKIENFMTELNNSITIDNIVVGSCLIYYFSSNSVMQYAGRGLMPIYTNNTNLFIFEIPSGGGDIYLYISD